MTLASNGLANALPYRWTYADATARTSDTGFTSADVGALALQLDTGSLYRLTATTPTWQLAAGTGDMLSTNNLSDVANVATARTNLGLGTAATHDVPASGDATATQVPLGNDSRLTDSRTPTAHATSHEVGGADAFTGVVPGSAFAPTGLTGATAASRYVGATASGAPATGTFALGDFVLDQTGKIWVCTTAGSPGTWTQLAGGGGGSLTVDEVDGAPSVAGVTRLTVSNGTLTDNGGGHATVATGGGGGMTDPETTAGDMIYRDGANVTSRLPVGAAGQVLQVEGGVPSWQDALATLTFVIDGGGAAITTGVKGYLLVPFACTIQQATLLADQTGSVVMDLWRCTYAQYDAGATHPAAADAITASAKPTISAATKAQDATLTGWTTGLAQGDILAFDVSSAATIQRLTVALRVRRG